MGCFVFETQPFQEVGEEGMLTLSTQFGSTLFYSGDNLYFHVPARTHQEGESILSRCRVVERDSITSGMWSVVAET